MTQTDNYMLNKPETEDPFDIADFNENTDIIDTELKRLDSEKQNTVSGAATSILNSNLTSGKVLVSSRAGKVEASAVDSSDLKFVQGVKSNIQAQIDGKSSVSHSHTVKEIVGFVPIQQSGGAGQLDNKIYIGWSGNKLKAQVDTTDMGAVITDGAGNNAILPVSKGGTGATSSAAAESNIMPVSTVTDKTHVFRNLLSYCIPDSVFLKKIGKRVNATFIFSNVSSDASCKVQIAQLASSYTPKGIHVGIVNAMTFNGHTYSRGCGYINASAENGIITLILPSVSASYASVEVFLDYYLE